MSTQRIIQPMSSFERERAAAKSAAIEEARRHARCIVEGLERSLGVAGAYPATRHAVEILDQCDRLEKGARA